MVPITGWGIDPKFSILALRARKAIIITRTTNTAIIITATIITIVPEFGGLSFRFRSQAQGSDLGLCV